MLHSLTQLAEADKTKHTEKKKLSYMGKIRYNNSCFELQLAVSQIHSK